MKTLAWRSGAVAAGGLVLWLLNLAIDPVPVAAGPAFILGAACYLFPQLDRRQHVANLAALTGAFIGAYVHRGWHVSGQSPPPPEGLVQHVFFEGLTGLLAAVLCLAVVHFAIKKLQTGPET